MATYVLTLPVGQITRNADGTFRGQLFDSQKLESAWSPTSPENNGGWKAGDKLMVVCGFHTSKLKDYPDNEQPTPSDFFGLSVDALYDPTQQEIISAENTLKRKSSGIVGSGITVNSTPNNNTDVFYKAISYTENVNLQPASRGTITDIVYMWSMDFNSNFNNNGKGNIDTLKMELIFGYGDPMIAESLT